MKQWGREHGADYMLSGVINSIEDSEGGEAIVFYQVDLTLINLETNAKSWQGQKKIKKYIDMGGMLITTADQSNTQFTQSVMELMKKLYPDYKYKPLDPQDELANVVFKVDTSRLGAQVLSNGVRHLAIHLPRGDVSWKLHADLHGDAADLEMKRAGSAGVEVVVTLPLKAAG